MLRSLIVPRSKDLAPFRAIKNRIVRASHQSSRVRATIKSLIVTVRSDFNDFATIKNLTVRLGGGR